MSDKARELRAGVYDAALAIAVKLLPVIHDGALTAAEMQDHIDVDGIDWHIICTYDQNTEGVAIDGHPCSFPGLQKKIDDAGSAVEFLEEVNEAGVLRQQLRFSWSMPANWLERFDHGS